MPQTQEDIKYMRRCLELASLGRQNVSTNPMVGAVLVHQNRIIGEGFHQKYGEAHAEVNAINSVQEDDVVLIPKSTMYVSLEPCSHYGKTPPCSDLIIKSKIPRVVIACIDSFSEVAGRGVEKLQSSGIEVTVGVLEEEARELNKRFFTFHEKKRPYVILKWAESSDGFMDKNREEGESGVNWITQPETQQLTHQWRAEEDAILVGYKTVLNDNPSLTVRAVKGKNPTRIILASEMSISQEASVNDSSAETKYYDPELNSLQDILEDLYKHSIQSLIIEGGSSTLQNFIDQDLWDEARILFGFVEFKDGLLAPKIQGRIAKSYSFGKDQIQVLRND